MFINNLDGIFGTINCQTWVHDILAKDWLKRVELVASSPAQYSVIEGNTDFNIVGLERFQNYYFPYIERACEILHSKGNLAGAHLDANNKRLAPHSAKHHWILLNLSLLHRIAK